MTALEPIEGAPPPLKQREFGPLIEPGCAWCGRTAGMLRPLPLFWRLRVDRFGVDLRAVDRQRGLGMAIGSPGIAAVMGPDEDMALPMMATAAIVVCEPYFTGPLAKLCASVMP